MGFEDSTAYVIDLFFVGYREREIKEIHTVIVYILNLFSSSGFVINYKLNN